MNAVTSDLTLVTSGGRAQKKMYEVGVYHNTCCDYEEETLIILADSKDEAERIALANTQITSPYRFTAITELTEAVEGVYSMGYHYGAK